MWVCLVCLLLCKEECSSPVFLKLLRGGIWACMKRPSLCLCWVLGWGQVSQLPYVWYYVVVKSCYAQRPRSSRRSSYPLATNFSNQLKITTTSDPETRLHLPSSSSQQTSRQASNSGNCLTAPHLISLVRFNQMGSPCANNHCSTGYEQTFRHNKTYTH